MSGWSSWSSPSEGAIVRKFTKPPPSDDRLEQDEIKSGQFCFSCGEAIHAEGREGRWGSIGRAGRQSGRPPHGNPARWFASGKPTTSQSLPVDLVPFRR